MDATTDKEKQVQPAQVKKEWIVHHSTTLYPVSFDNLDDAIKFAVKFNAIRFDYFLNP